MRYRPSKRRGIALIYCSLALVVMAAFVSFAVDWGRVQLVKTELQRAADAAARHAATGVMTSAATAQANAIAAAGDNTADGSAVVLTAADVVTGHWDAATRAFTAAGTPLNAVRVTARRAASRGTAVPLMFAGMFGFPTFDVSATAIGLNAPPAVGVVGLESVEVQNDAVIDSYRSATGPYSLATRRANGDVASNGPLTIKDDAAVHGDLRRRSGQTVVGTPLAPGQVLTMPAPIVYPVDTLPGGTTDLGDYDRSGTGSSTLSPGIYRASKFFVDGNHTLNIVGSVTVYVSGDVKFSNTAGTSGNLPANFRIRVTSTSHSVLLDNAGLIEAEIYAPGVPVVISNNAVLSGSVIGRSLLVQDTAKVHFDETAGGGGAGSASGTSLVR